MKFKRYLLPTLIAIILLIYGNIVFSAPAAFGTGHNQGEFGGFGQDSCGNVEVTDVSDNCPSGNDAINSYTMSVTLRNTNSNKPITIHGEMRTYWCTPDQLRSANKSIGQGANSCYSNGKTFFPTFPVLNKGDSFTFTSPPRTANVCGAVYQNDFNYTYQWKGKTCQNSKSAIRYHAAYGYCVSNAVCVTPTQVAPTVIPPVVVTEVPTEAPIPPVVPPPSTNTSSCASTDQSGNNGGNNNANCNQQQQQQNQNQYNNNNQSVNVSIASPQQPAPPVSTTTETAPVPPVSYPAPVSQLPSTGPSADVFELLVGLAPLGVFLRKLA